MQLAPRTSPGYPERPLQNPARSIFEETTDMYEADELILIGDSGTAPHE